MTYKGTENVAKAIEVKIRNELKCFNEEDFEAPPSDMEEYFLSKISKLNLNEEEILCTNTFDWLLLCPLYS